MLSLEGVGINLSSSIARESASTPSPYATPAIEPASQSQSTTKPEIVATQDNIVLSEQSIRMSQVLQGNDNLQEAAKTPKKAEAQVSANKSATYFDVTKNFPPFLSNKRKMEIMENYPFLRKEIEKMTVPPPFELAYSEQPILQQVTASKLQKVG